MKDILRQLFTGKDNQTHDIARWSWVISLFGVFASTAAIWAHNQTIDLQALGTAIATVVGAHGAAIWAKKDSEPDDSNSNN